MLKCGEWADGKDYGKINIQTSSAAEWSTSIDQNSLTVLRDCPGRAANALGCLLDLRHERIPSARELLADGSGELGYRPMRDPIACLVRSWQETPFRGECMADCHSRWCCMVYCTCSSNWNKLSKSREVRGERRHGIYGDVPELLFLPF